MKKNNLPYIDRFKFDAMVEELAKTNWILKSLLTNMKTWEDLPLRLIEDLFNKLECKPSIQKY